MPLTSVLSKTMESKELLDRINEYEAMLKNIVNSSNFTNRQRTRTFVNRPMMKDEVLDIMIPKKISLIEHLILHLNRTEEYPRFSIKSEPYMGSHWTFYVQNSSYDMSGKLGIPYGAFMTLFHPDGREYMGVVYSHKTTLQDYWKTFNNLKSTLI